MLRLVWSLIAICVQDTFEERLAQILKEKQELSDCVIGFDCSLAMMVNQKSSTDGFLNWLTS